MNTLQNIVQDMGCGHMANTAYETAWIGRLAGIDPSLGNEALYWLGENQNPDGSWGAQEINYYHDRVISTLSAMIALTYNGQRLQDKAKIERGLCALEKMAGNATKGLASDPNGATVGFEMIVPTLMSEAERLGIIKQRSDGILGQLAKMRKLKMAKLSGLKINRKMASSLSIEMAGRDSIEMLDVENLQEPNGSVGCSPASTAYFALQVKPGDEQALHYLRGVVKNGGAPFVAPFDIFERCWILWNVSQLDEYDTEMRQLIQPHLDFLEQQWVPGQGVSFVTDSVLVDSDDSSVTHQVLTRFGRQPDVEALLSYEEEHHFRCYRYEINPSLGANIHLLGALKLVGYEKEHPAIQKILRFIRGARYNNTYWFDKWHASPYYITSHAIIECRGYDNELCETAVKWLLDNQKADGSWGFYSRSTAEETAYCLMALKIWQKSGGKIPWGRIEMATRWLSQHSEPPYPWMWIGKTLYYPEYLIQSAIYTALAL